MAGMKRGENGNVFFYIFLCIGLLAALTFAIAQGGRGGTGKLSEDRQRLAATEIISFGDTVAKAVTQLRLRGTAVTQLSFAVTFLSAGYGTPGAAPANEIFNPAGGAAVYRPVPAEAADSAQDYQFLAGNEVENIGTTCGAKTCHDLLIAAPGLREEVCMKINDLLGITNPGGVPPQDTDIDETTLFAPGADPFAASGETLGDEDAALDGKSEGCFAETGETPDEYVYYKVLLPQ